RCGTACEKQNGQRLWVPACAGTTATIAVPNSFSTTGFINAIETPSLVASAALEVNVDVLLAREAQKLLDALFAPDAGLLVAAERRAEEMLRHLVDPHVARFDRGGGAVRGREIVGPDRAGEPVFDLVDLGQHLVLVAPFEHREHRPEDLLLADAHGH